MGMDWVRYGEGEKEKEKYGKEREKNEKRSEEGESDGVEEEDRVHYCEVREFLQNDEREMLVLLLVYLPFINYFYFKKSSLLIY